MAPNHPVFIKTPTTGKISKKSNSAAVRNLQTQFSLMSLHDDQEKLKNSIETAHPQATKSPAQEGYSSNNAHAMKLPGPEPYIEFTKEAYPFIEEPVTFNFGDDYGDEIYQLFLGSQQVLLYENEDDSDVVSRGGGEGTAVEVDGLKYSRSDVYILSPEAAMINCFLGDNLL